MSSIESRRDQVAALTALLYHADPRYRPAQLRGMFEQNMLPLDILRQGDGSQLVPEDRSGLLRQGHEDVTAWASAGIDLLTPFGEKYPAQLASVFDYPVLLFARGIVRDDQRSAAIVGSRAVSPGGLRFAADLGKLLALDGVTVVSGLAHGVDGSAHEAALNAGGRTVAVLGNGLNRVYPREHAGLQSEIAQRGLLISQFLPDSSPTRQSFPQRNIVMSAYSSMTVIVEASEKSGTRIQADAAVKHGRPLILTRQVVQSTSWGRRYADGTFNVAVVATPGEARRAVAAMLERAYVPAPVLS